MRFITLHSYNAEGILWSVARRIGEEVYSYGISPEYRLQYRSTAAVLYKMLKVNFYDEYTQEFQARLQRCMHALDTAALLKAEIKARNVLSVKMCNATDNARAFILGYDYETLKQDDPFGDDRVGIFEPLPADNYSFYKRVWVCAHGAATYNIEMYLAGLYTKSESTTSNEVKKEEVTVPDSKFELSDFIRAEFHQLFRDAEESMRGEIDGWRIKSRGYKIACAGFCEALFVKKWFAGVKPGPQSVNNDTVRDFAQWWYKVDIENQLLADKKVEREKQRDKYLKRLNK